MTFSEIWKKLSDINFEFWVWFDSLSFVMKLIIIAMALVAGYYVLGLVFDLLWVALIVGALAVIAWFLRQKTL